MDAWLREKGILLRGGDVDESPMVYRRLEEVLAYHRARSRSSTPSGPLRSPWRALASSTLTRIEAVRRSSKPMYGSVSG